MRKLLSGLLVLVMLVALLPVTALAAQEVGLGGSRRRPGKTGLWF